MTLEYLDHWEDDASFFEFSWLLFKKLEFPIYSKNILTLMFFLLVDSEYLSMFLKGRPSIILNYDLMTFKLILKYKYAIPENFPCSLCQ